MPRRVLLIAIAIAACDEPAPAASSAPGPARDDGPALALVERFECHRCHEVPGVPSAPVEKSCVGCHREILAGTFAGGAPADVARWARNIRSLPAAPSLAAARRLRRDWIEAFLLRPVDVRPHLRATMPRLAITADEARTLAALLVPDEADTIDLAGADPANGERLFQARGCAGCHDAAGAAPPSDARTLAPDLARVRERLQPGRLVAWIRDPSSVAPGATMPAPGVTDVEARDLAAYLWGREAPAAPPPAPETRLPPLDREVRYDEVAERVFRTVCWHCHGAEHYAEGDGGPGNTGGLGFAGRGLDLSSYAGSSSGSRGDDGRRRSVFAPLPDGTPRLVAHLLARRAEERGETPELRGMPMGFPALSLEDIQLVESWIAQGRPE